KFHIYTTQKFVQPEEGILLSGTDESGQDPGNEPIVGFQLYQNYPNPCCPSTTIPYSLPDVVESATISVYDILERLVKKQQVTNYLDLIQFDAYGLSS